MNAPMLACPDIAEADARPAPDADEADGNDRCPPHPTLAPVRTASGPSPLRTSIPTWAGPQITSKRVQQDRVQINEALPGDVGLRGHDAAREPQGACALLWVSAAGLPIQLGNPLQAVASGKSSSRPGSDDGEAVSR